MTERSVLAWAAAAHGVLAVACAVGLLFHGERIVGAHAMAKPLKFAISIGLFLGTMSVVLPMVSVSPPTRVTLAWLLTATMVIEMAVILIQALRGTTSHYNDATGLDRHAWHAMLVAIIAATFAMAAVAFIATVRPLRGADGHELPALSALAWRVGLWAFQLAAVSGFAMGGRGQHTVGAPDGGPGLPGVGWSLGHGDLRISHFVALHALQVLPLVALGLRASRLTETARWSVLGAVIATHALVVIWTLWRALAGRTPW